MRDLRGNVTPPAVQRALAKVRRAGVVRARDLQAAGLSRTGVGRLVAEGRLERVGWGLYRLPEGPLGAGSDLAQAARLVPQGVVCLLSALRFHGLTTQNPAEVWIAIEQKAWRPKVDRPPIRFVYMSGATMSEGVETHRIDRVPVRISGPARTVADCFKYRNKIGLDVAVEALRDFRRRHPKRLEELWTYAKLDRVTRVMRPYVEAIG